MTEGEMDDDIVTYEMRQGNADEVHQPGAVVLATFTGERQVVLKQLKAFEGANPGPMEAVEVTEGI